MMGVAFVIGFPVLGVFDHHPVENRTDLRSSRIGDPLLLDARQAKDSLTESEREFGAYLEDGEMIANQRRERRVLCAGLGSRL